MLQIIFFFHTLLAGKQTLHSMSTIVSRNRLQGSHGSERLEKGGRCGSGKYGLGRRHFLPNNRQLQETLSIPKLRISGIALPS